MRHPDPDPGRLVALPTEYDDTFCDVGRAAGPSLLRHGLRRVVEGVHPDSIVAEDEGVGAVRDAHGRRFGRPLEVQDVALEDQSGHVQRGVGQFGEEIDRPLSTNQGVAFPLAEAETLLTAARLLCYRTLWLKDTGQPHTTEAAMCKWWAPTVAYDVIGQCLLLHGQFGYRTELPVEQRLRDVLGLQIGDGTAQIMKLIISRQKLGRELAP